MSDAIQIGFQLLFWGSAVAVGIPYFLYPATLCIVHRLLRTRTSTPSFVPVDDRAELPRVTLIISAYNEAAVIAGKLDNTLELDYPRERLDVLVISDESDDGTDAVVARYTEQGVRLRRQEPRAGKSAGLTRFVPESSGEILVFSDANAMYDSQALLHLTRRFSDPKIGYVVGHQRYYDEGQGAAGESEKLYWTLEVAMKEAESAVGSVVGGDGAIYAIRRELFAPLRADDISDFVNPLQIIARGYRGVFEPQAYCFEHTATTFEGEFRRKVRIVNRSLRGALRVPAALNPFKVGWFAVQLHCHKTLRWFAPYFLILLLTSNAVLVAGGAGTIYQATLFAQLTLYASALAAFAVPILGRLKPLYIAYYFCLVNVAALLGTAGVLTGKSFVVWKPQR